MSEKKKIINEEELEKVAGGNKGGKPTSGGGNDGNTAPDTFVVYKNEVEEVDATVIATTGTTVAKNAFKNESTELKLQSYF